MTEMTIKFQCPHCQTGLAAGVKYVGKTGLCPYCGKEITVPEKDDQIQSGKKRQLKKNKDTHKSTEQ